MSMRAAHHPGVGLAGLVQVVGVAAFAAEQDRVFGALHPLADSVAAGRGFVRISHRPIIADLKSGTDPHFSAGPPPWPPTSSAALPESLPTRSTARSARRSRTSSPT